jgi:mannose-6-phosphate isomerase-like protein (cupin superfamily)
MKSARPNFVVSSQKHIADELIHILDGMATLDVAGEDGPQSLALRAGMMTVIPQGTWHRFRSAKGVTLMTATPFPSETIEDDLDDPRMVESKAI